MITARAWSALGALLALGALVVAALAGVVAPLAPAALDWQPTRAFEQPWRAWTAAFVHWSPRHLAANLLGLALVTALGIVAACRGRAALAWALAWPLTHLALALQPALRHYGGLSGVLHAGVAVAAWALARGRAGPRRWIGVLLLGGLAAKVLLETPWAGPLRQVAGWDIPVAPLAHASGALAGLACAAIVHASVR